MGSDVTRIKSLQQLETRKSHSFQILHHPFPIGTPSPPANWHAAEGDIVFPLKLTNIGAHLLTSVEMKVIGPTWRPKGLLTPLWIFAAKPGIKCQHLGKIHWLPTLTVASRKLTVKRVCMCVCRCSREHWSNGSNWLWPFFFFSLDGWGRYPLGCTLKS